MGEMIGLTAHQWMQPLSIISTFIAKAELELLVGVVDEKYLSTIFSKINENVKFLSTTVNDFRNFFKSESLLETSIAEVLRFSLSIIQPIIQDNNINLIFDEKIIKDIKGTKIVTVYKNDLTQVFLNLIKNSMDALLALDIDDPYIEIKLSVKDSNFIIEFMDNAGGIPQEYLDKVFENDFSTKGEKGTVLGLYMSRMIVEQHLNGTINVHNSDKGACFHITLPILAT